MAPYASVEGLIFDIGDVLFMWSPHTKTTISPSTMKTILTSPTWYEYECGRMTREACYKMVSQELSLESAQVAEAFAQARASLQPDNKMVGFIKNLKKITSVKVYAMSNIGNEDFEVLKRLIEPGIFERVFTSGAVGMRKPDPEFYRMVLDEIKVEAENAVFVDDKKENVNAAQALGIRGLVFDETARVIGALQEIFHGPITRGLQYLRNAPDCNSITDGGVIVKDNFAELLIVEATKDP